MAQSTLGRIWNRIADRYSSDSGADCCGTTIEAVESDSSDAESDSCCD